MVNHFETNHHLGEYHFSNFFFQSSNMHIQAGGGFFFFRPLELGENDAICGWSIIFQSKVPITYSHLVTPLVQRKIMESQ